MLSGCDSHPQSEKPVSWLVCLDNTKSVPDEDRREWPLILDGFWRYVDMERGDQVAVFVVQENSRNQRPARLKYFRLRRRLDPEFVEKNQEAMNRFKEKVMLLTESSGNSKFSDIFGALNLGARYFKAVDSSFAKVMVVISDGLHNTNNEREIKESLIDVSVTWVGLNPGRFDEIAPEYEAKLRSAGAKVLHLLPRTGVDQLILGELKITESRRVER